MADDLVQVHGRCGRRCAALVADVGPGQWHDDTPCPQWDVRTLVHHLLSEQRWVPPTFEGLTIEQVGDRFDGDLMGDDASTWPGLLASAMEKAHAVLAQPRALERTVPSPSIRESRAGKSPTRFLEAALSGPPVPCADFRCAGIPEMAGLVHGAENGHTTSTTPRVRTRFPATGRRAGTGW
jgi:hypothetical protein